MKSKLIHAVSVLSLTTFANTANAGNWPHWRGPNFNGATDNENLPAEFSRTNNVKWVANLPGPSAGTPIIWNDYVFVSSTETKTRTLRAIALDRKTGKQLWDNSVVEAFNQDDRSNFASPSPVSDGERAIFYYGTGDLAAFDLKGEKLWSRNLAKDYGPFAFQWTYSASPTLFEGKLFIEILQRDVPVRGRGRGDGPIDSYVLALDPKTGKELWKHVRPCDAVMESREAYSTPIPFVDGKRKELLIVGGDCISGHSLDDGKELWRWGTWNPTRIGHWRLVPSPVVGDGVALATAPKGAPVYAVKLGGNGTLDDKSLAWTSAAEREISSDVSTPLFYRGRFYVVNSDKRTIARVDPATGKSDWIGEFGTRSKIEASPTAADGKIYVQNFRGEVFVVGADKDFKILHTTAMGDDSDNDNRSSLSIAQGGLFIRTAGKLYCVSAGK